VLPAGTDPQRLPGDQTERFGCWRRRLHR
jgi:hypothetical protein